MSDLLPYQWHSEGILDLASDAFPWWTSVDTAELAERTNEMVDALFDHREAGCAVCENRNETAIECTFVRSTIEAVVEWRDRRERSNRLRMVRIAEQKIAAAQRTNPIPIDRLVEILRETSP